MQIYLEVKKKKILSVEFGHVSVYWCAQLTFTLTSFVIFIWTKKNKGQKMSIIRKIDEMRKMYEMKSFE